ncbi:MAG TPA: DNA polymerase III subunit delta [Longilinea sp.]|nr:DNA polymerase III subunit delta [Longilinea sp.]
MNDPIAPTMKPIVYLLHGDDEFGMRQFVNEMVAHLGDDPTTRSMNLVELDGRSAGEEDIHSAAFALPFLAERRIVVLEHPLERLNGNDARARFAAMLERLPETTALVLLLSDEFKSGGRDKGWQQQNRHAWLFDWRQKAGPRAFYRVFKLPSFGEMSGWVVKQAEAQGGKFTPRAAQELAARIGSDTQTASQEITKLLTYVDFARPVEPADVEALCITSEGPTNLFGMIDALAEGNARTAIKLLHDLLETEDAASLFAMIVRQFRLLIQAREIIDESGKAAAIGAELHQVSFVAEKLERQARRFSLAQLKSIYRRLLEIDLAAKTSQMPLDVALDEFIVRMQ